MVKAEENKKNLLVEAEEFFWKWDANRITEKDAIRPDLAGMTIFEYPLLGISDARDPLYRELKKPHIVGPWHRLPQEWLETARTVVSLFFPFSEQVKKAQRLQKEETSSEWLHARIEGQAAMLGFAQELSSWIIGRNEQAIVPVMNPGFVMITFGEGITGYRELSERTFGSNWSERHVAFISGLGTFSLSKGLITERGIAGRFCSIVTSMELPVTERRYTRYDEWCTRCGACMRRCPAKAISLETGKNHILCGNRVNASKMRYAPRYGCGQCQTNVPCESARPAK